MQITQGTPTRVRTPVVPPTLHALAHAQVPAAADRGAPSFALRASTAALRAIVGKTANTKAPTATLETVPSEARD